MTRSADLIGEDLATIAAAVRPIASPLAGRTLLLSGGAGFLGRYFRGVFRLLNAEVLRPPLRVISVDNYVTGAPDPTEASDQNIHSLWADVTRPLPLREPVHYIIHAAGLASPVYYQQYPLETIDAAIRGTENLLELARKNGLQSFLLFSSSEIYGDPDPSAIPTPETYCGNVSSVGPRACYDESKRLAETITQVYRQRFGAPTRIVRPFNIYGPGMRPDDYRVVPTFALRLLRGEVLPVHGDGLQTRSFCYVTDALTGFCQVLLRGRPGEIYNVGNDESEIAMRDLAQLFAELAPTGARTACIPYPPTYPAGEPQRRLPDLTKIRTELGYVPKVSLRKGIARFLEWARIEPAYAAASPVVAGSAGR